MPAPILALPLDLAGLSENLFAWFSVRNDPQVTDCALFSAYIVTPSCSQ